MCGMKSKLVFCLVVGLVFSSFAMGGKGAPRKPRGVDSRYGLYTYPRPADDFAVDSDDDGLNFDDAFKHVTLTHIVPSNEQERAPRQAFIDGAGSLVDLAIDELSEEQDQLFWNISASGKPFCGVVRSDEGEDRGSFKLVQILSRQRCALFKAAKVKQRLTFKEKAEK